MITYCDKCKINWAALWTGNDNSEESVDYCPLCGTDMYLHPGNDIVAYMRCPFTGDIINVETKEKYMSQPVLPPMPRKVKVFDESFEEWEERRMQAEDAGIAAGSFALVDMPVRKHHFEEIIF